MNQGYYKATPKKPVAGYNVGQSYKCIVLPTFTKKLCIYKSVMTSDGIVFPEHSGYKTFADEAEIKESFDLVAL